MDGIQRLPKVASEVDAFEMFTNENVVEAAKTLLPLNVLLLASSVEDAAVMVTEPPAFRPVPLIVPRVPLRRLVPIVVVAITLPLASEARSELEVALSSIRLKALRPVKVLLSVRRVEEAEVAPTHVPLIEKQPPARSKPPAE